MRRLSSDQLWYEQQTPKHTVFISSKGKQSKEFQKILTETIKPMRDEINIRSIRSTENVLILETESEEESIRLMEVRNWKKYYLKIEKPRKRDPLVILYDLPTVKTEEEIKEIIYRQNFEDLVQREEFENQFKFRFKVGLRNKSTVHHVCEVSPKLRRLC